MEIRYDTVKKWSFLYLSLPLLCFSVFFLRPFVAILSCIAIGYALKKSLNRSASQDSLPISKQGLILLVVFLLVWTWLGGLNGLFYQSDDWPWRNAVYHDLIRYDWPVVYPEKGWALVYYVGFWLPPALLSKLVALCAGADSAWAAGQFFLWLWTVAGLFLLCLVMFFLLQATTRRQRILVVLLFVFFSGLDIVGALLNHKLDMLLSPNVIHLEWWTNNGKQYSSITTCLYWVFNQAVIPWLVTVWFCKEDSPENYLLLGMSCFVCGPLPFVGLVILMLSRWVVWLWQSLKKGALPVLLRKTVSVQNCTILFLVFPPLAAYYLSNLSLIGGNAQRASDGLNLWQKFRQTLSLNLILFLILDCGIYLLLLCKKHRKDPLFYSVGGSLLLIPFFQIGYAEDFCMRASIPALFILFLFCTDKILTEHRHIGTLCLAAALCIGAVTPAVEIGRGIYHVLTEKTIFLAQTQIESIGSEEMSQNFLTKDYQNTIFFQYFGRKS